jgi:hypothetical protein
VKTVNPLTAFSLQEAYREGFADGFELAIKIIDTFKPEHSNEVRRLRDSQEAAVQLPLLPK